MQAKGGLAHEQLRGLPLGEGESLDAKRQHLIMPSADTLRNNQRPAALMDMEVSWDIVKTMMAAVSSLAFEVFRLPHSCLIARRCRTYLSRR